jgi:hypothetical protein
MHLSILYGCPGIELLVTLAWHQTDVQMGANMHLMCKHTEQLCILVVAGPPRATCHTVCGCCCCPRCRQAPLTASP